MNGSVVFEIERPENGGLKRPIRVRTRRCIPEISIEPSRNLPGTFQEPSRDNGFRFHPLGLSLRGVSF